MAYDEQLADRFRQYLKDQKGISEKRMMGGIVFLLDGNMLGGADRTRAGIGRYMFRVGKDNASAASALPGAEPMFQGGRRMRGLFFVAEENGTDAVFEQWLTMALDHAKTLPPK